MITGIRRPWRLRERESAWALACLCLASTCFVAWPAIDLWVAAQAYDPEGRVFVGDRSPLIMAIYHAVPWVGRAVGVLGLLVAVTAWRSPGRWGVRWWRRCMFAGLAMAVAVGLLVNVTFKENWGRARPWQVQGLGGDRPFTPAWQPARGCARNCSFVSGHAATGFALMAFGALAGARARRHWRHLGLLAGVALGLARVSQGAHFLSDIVLAGAMTWVCCCALRWAWIGWRAAAMRRRRRRGWGRRGSWVG